MKMFLVRKKNLRRSGYGRRRTQGKSRLTLWTGLAIFWVWISGLSGGTITGTVTHERSGEPLAGANVVIVGTDLGAATDLNGYFQISELPAGDAQIRVSMIGFSERQIGVTVVDNQPVEIDIALEPAVLQSEKSILVLGNRKQDRNLDTYRAADLTSTETLLSRLEGVELITRGAFAPEPVLRGLSGGQVNITIDGMKCFGACTDRMDPVTSYIEIETLKSLDVNLGATSLENGSTIGGNLNLSNLQPELSDQPQMMGFVKSEYQSVMNGQKLVAEGSLSRPRWGLNVSTTYRKAENYRHPDGQRIPYTQYEKINYTAGWLLKTGNRSRLRVDFLGDDARNVGYAALPMDVGYAGMRSAGITWEVVNLHPQLPQVEIKLYGNVVDHQMDDTQRDSLFMNMHMDMPGLTRTAGGYLRGILLPGANLMIKMKTDLYRNSHYADMVMYPDDSTPMKLVTWPDVLQWHWGQFVELQRAVGRTITLKANLRYDFNRAEVRDDMGIRELRIYYPGHPLQRDDHLLAANIFGDWQVNSYWKTTFGIARGSRLPTVTEMYGYYLYVVLDGYLYLGNPDIRPETSRQLEWRNLIQTDWFDLNVTLYDYRIQNYIAGQIRTEDIDMNYAHGWKVYENAGTARLQGLEASLRSDLTWRWSVLIGGSLEYGRLPAWDDDLPMIAPPEIHGAVKYKRYPAWIQLDWQWKARQERIADFSGENETPAYTVWALRGEYIINNHWILNAGIDNLTNVVYHDHLDWVDIPRPGRNFYMSLNWQSGD